MGAGKPVSARTTGRGTRSVTRGIVTVGVLMALVAAGCSFLSRPIPGTNGIAQVVVSPPGVGGSRTVDVAVVGVAPGTKATVTVRVDSIDGKPVATAKTVPAQLTVGGDAIGSGDHFLFVKVRIDHRFAVGAAVVSGDLRLNQMQVKGTHNSFHIAPTEAPFTAIEPWQYTNSPLGEQFESEGVRQIELDVYVDPAGHRVLHIPDIDFATTCATYVDCLTAVKAWSDAHPDHMPIAILTELKDDDLGLPTPVLPWTVAAMDQLDDEIRSVFPPAQVLTPDEVRATFPTLDAAVHANGWPKIDDLRGQVLFLMDNSGSYRSNYLSGHPALAGRMLFTNATPGAPDAAFVKRNNPEGVNVTEIQALVAQGYVVRTRTDSDTVEARANDTTKRDAALSTAAQWVSTDFPVPGRAFGTPYFVSIPGGTPARCNPINAPPWCTSSLIEDLGG